MYIMWGKYISYCSSSKDFQINEKYVFMDIEYAFDGTEIFCSKIFFQ